MEGLARLVSETLERHSVETTLDCSRLRWSPWFSCGSNVGLRAPGKPGLYALAEDLGVFCGASEPPSRHSDPESKEEGYPNGQKRMLALFQISEVEDLGVALGRLFLPRSPERERLASGRCCARYCVIEDAVQRRTAHVALQRWVVSAAEAVSSITSDSPEPIASGF